MVKHWTIQQFVAEKKRKAQLRLSLLPMALAFACVVVTPIVSNMTQRHEKPKPEPLLIEGKRYGANLKNRGDDQLWSAWRDAALVAREKWAAVTPRLRLVPAQISMIADPEQCGPAAYACTDTINNIIYVAKADSSVDRVTVMMHEIGHLMGVPHIEGDPLMDAAYQGVVLDSPSDAAVAICRYRESKLLTFGFTGK